MPQPQQQGDLDLKKDTNNKLEKETLRSSSTSNNNNNNINSNEYKIQQKEPEFEDISYEIYPERKPDKEISTRYWNWSQNWVRLQCRTKIDKAIQSSK